MGAHWASGTIIESIYVSDQVLQPVGVQAVRGPVVVQVVRRPVVVQVVQGPLFLCVRITLLLVWLQYWQCPFEDFCA